MNFVICKLYPNKAFKRKTYTETIFIVKNHQVFWTNQKQVTGIRHSRKTPSEINSKPL